MQATAFNLIFQTPPEPTEWPIELVSSAFSVETEGVLTIDEELADFREGLEDLKEGRVMDLDVALSKVPSA